MNLDFNPKLFAVYPASVTDGIIKHELVHYHLYDHHRGYQHRDHDFKQLLDCSWRVTFCATVASERPSVRVCMHPLRSPIRSSPAH